MEKINPLGYLSDYDIMDLMECLSWKLKKSRSIYFSICFFDYQEEYLSDIRKHSMFPEDRKQDPLRLKELDKIAEKISDKIFDDENKEIQLAKRELARIAAEIEEKEVR